MKKKKSKKIAQETALKFRERKIRDIPKELKHPDPLPGFIPTLPGPPGWDSKMNPRGLKLSWLQKKKK